MTSLPRLRKTDVIADEFFKRHNMLKSLDIITDTLSFSSAALADLLSFFFGRDKAVKLTPGKPLNFCAPRPDTHKCRAHRWTNLLVTTSFTHLGWISTTPPRTPVV